MRLLGVLQSNFSCLSQSESQTQHCHVRISIIVSDSVAQIQRHDNILQVQYTLCKIVNISYEFIT